MLAILMMACAQAPSDVGPDLFRVAVSRGSLGSLLGVWGDDTTRFVYVVVGYVGVERDHRRWSRGTPRRLSRRSLRDALRSRRGAPGGHGAHAAGG